MHTLRLLLHYIMYNTLFIQVWRVILYYDSLIFFRNKNLIFFHIHMRMIVIRVFLQVMRCHSCPLKIFFFIFPQLPFIEW